MPHASERPRIHVHNFEESVTFESARHEVICHTTHILYYSQMAFYAFYALGFIFRNQVLLLKVCQGTGQEEPVLNSAFAAWIKSPFCREYDLGRLQPSSIFLPGFQIYPRLNSHFGASVLQSKPSLVNSLKKSLSCIPHDVSSQSMTVIMTVRLCPSHLDEQFMRKQRR